MCVCVCVCVCVTHLLKGPCIALRKLILYFNYTGGRHSLVFGIAADIKVKMWGSELNETKTTSSVQTINKRARRDVEQRRTVVPILNYIFYY